VVNGVLAGGSVGLLIGSPFGLLSSSTLLCNLTGV
jgi:hypothetical protein